ncbi:hypothetical protein M422DRAFT_264327, partial [Sphaerobolus stellatus SS14]
TDTELRAYQRGFQAVAHYLIKEKTITEDERDRYYWFGLHEITRKTLEQRLAATRPDHPRSKAYKWTDVFAAGKYLFDINAFDKNPPEGFTMPELESKPQGGSFDIVTRKVAFPTTPSEPPSSSNIDELLLRIKSLTVRDQEYAATYAKIQATNPMTAELLWKPLS